MSSPKALLYASAMLVVVAVVAAVKVQSNAFSDRDLQAAFSHAQSVALRELSSRRSAAALGFVAESGFAARHQQTTRVHTTDDEDRLADEFEAATKFLKENGNVTDASSLSTLSLGGLGESELQRSVSRCQRDFRPPLACVPGQLHYTLDGSCNNLANPRWGSTKSCFRRILPAAFDDGVAAPRTHVNGQVLANPRHISNSLFSITNEKDTLDMKWSHARMTFGQVLAHDLVLTPTTRAEGGQPLDCCAAGNRMSQCMPIMVPPNDPFYSAHNLRCLNFVRSMPCVECSLGPRVQMNGVTPYLDLSHQYGTDEAQARLLRTLDGTGFLRGGEDIDAGGIPLFMLPKNATAAANDSCSQPKRPCFEAGDFRVNQHVGIVAWQTLFHRYHNKLAQEIRRQRPTFSDDQLYRLARRISIAQFQLIVYREWLPSVLPSAYLDRFDLGLNPFQQRGAYNRLLNPQLSTEFATAAFRFGHSLVRNAFEFSADMNTVLGSVETKDAFSRIPDYYNRSVTFNPQNFVNGFYTSKGSKIGPKFVDGIRNFLYRTSSSPNAIGMDLPAINIQRGRDHGFRSYVSYRQGRRAVKTFKDFEQEWVDVCLKQVPLLYKDVSMVDLYVGAMCEKPVEEHTMGHTFAHIIAEQFHRLKNGDRLFVSHHDGAFTQLQYSDMHSKTSLSNIFCLAYRGDISNPRRHPFLLNGPSETINCNAVPFIRVSLFDNLRK